MTNENVPLSKTEIEILRQEAREYQIIADTCFKQDEPYSLAGRSLYLSLVDQINQELESYS